MSSLKFGCTIVGHLAAVMFLCVSPLVSYGQLIKASLTNVLIDNLIKIIKNEKILFRAFLTSFEHF